MCYKPAGDLSPCSIEIGETIIEVFNQWDCGKHFWKRLMQQRPRGGGWIRFWRLDSILLLCSHSARHRAVTQGIAAQNPLQDTSW
jgi:hypothetical protein